MKKQVLVCFFLIIQISALWAQFQDPVILTNRNGLSSLKVNATIAQDKDGFVWIGTEDGLNRYDGQKFTVYRKIENDTLSIRRNIITSVFSDSNNRLWIGSMAGLQYYDPILDCFKTKIFEILGKESLHRPILWIMEDSNKNVWFSFESLGILKYSLKTQEVTLYKPQTGGGYLCSPSIRNLAEDSFGNIWFSSLDKGITVYNQKKNEYIQYNNFTSSLKTNSIIRVVALAKGNMLISTLDDGIYVYERDSDSFRQIQKGVQSFSILRTFNNKILIGTEAMGLYTLDEEKLKMIYNSDLNNQNKTIINSKIHCVYEDKSGNLWVGMYNEGVAMFKHEPKGFTGYRRNLESENSLNYGQITAITTDRDKNIWFATDGGGLVKYDEKTEIYRHYKNRADNKESLPNDAVVGLLHSSKDDLWIGTYTGGLSKYNPKSDNFISYQHQEGRNSLPGNYVKCIVEDSKGNLWLGTDGMGLSYFDVEKGIFTNYQKSDNKELISDNITYLYLQGDSVLWIGGHFGIGNFNIRTEKFHIPDNPNIHDSGVYSISQDFSGKMWIGTSSGLFYQTAPSGIFTNTDLPEELRKVVVLGIVPYKNSLWLTTSIGLTEYDPQLGSIKNYMSNNEFGGLSFIRSSYYKSLDNKIFLGGGLGCYSFCPDSIAPNYTQKVYITNMNILNMPVAVGKTYNGRVILEKSLSYTNKITLNHSENSFTLFFSAPSALYPSSISYRCMMDGIDSRWATFPPSQQEITYANLPPGTYTFRIYASNIPNPEEKDITELTIEILPPIWLTWWAICIYAIIILIIVYIIFRMLYIRMKEKNELHLEKLKVKKQEELNQNKMQFFTNITHEFKTPLTLIISPLQSMLQAEKDHDRAHSFEMMIRNADRLQRLINQILDLRKAEFNKIEINAWRINLVAFVQHFTGLFSDIIAQKNISFTYKYDNWNTYVYYDPDLLEKCLYNLLFNALKFTPDGGRIALNIEQGDDDNILLSIEDNGTGIKDEDIPYLFDRFYQGALSKSSGTGIGLHLVRVIIELHHGAIGVKSKWGEGSCFTMFIKSGKEHFQKGQYTDDEWIFDEKGIIRERSEKISSIQDNTGCKDKSVILLVEDDIDMRIYISRQLTTTYHVVEAGNGRKALVELQTCKPDLIVCDVMMPEMNGLEFTKIVKENIETCHIPVILLTALDGNEQKIEGLETGADSYITKPFNVDYLHTRIKTMLEGRRKLQYKFSRQLDFEPAEITVTDPDEQLVQDCINYIRNNISDTDLTVERISQHLNVSRTNLHKKIKIATGNSPIELIRIIRMKQAALLLEKSKLTISEIAYETGYNSLSYFSTSFTQYWGITPTLFVQSRQNEEK